MYTINVTKTPKRTRQNRVIFLVTCPECIYVSHVTGIAPDPYHVCDVCHGRGMMDRSQVSYS